MLGTSKKDGGKGKHEVVGKGKDTANKIQESHFTAGHRSQRVELQIFLIDLINVFEKKGGIFRN
jgi:hypothetical protein